MLEVLHEISIVPPGRPEEKSQESTSHNSSHPVLDLVPAGEQVKASPPRIEQEPTMISDLILEPTSGSSASIASSFASSAVSSDKGAETEEDEGMILVGRPT
jgi:lysophosphatidate acyltransferase